MSLTIIGGGLAGAEAAWQAAKRGVPVTLYEKRPQKQTPAHRTGDLAELVCSNSFRAAATTNAVGLLKEEMRRLDSLIMAAADETAVPAGGALAVDRKLFSASVERRLLATGRVELRRQELATIPPQGVVIVATGPLTDGPLAAEIEAMSGGGLYFYDAVAPIVSGDSINRDVAYFASRYDKGDDDYLNCPLDEGEYVRFYEALRSAKVYEGHDFEKPKYFEGCMPIEEMAARGRDTMAFGPLKPVGLRDPRTGQRPYAVVQLRREDTAGSRFNLVGFQTHLLRGEQERVFRLIPGLEQAEFERYGMIHRNTYICSPHCLTTALSWNTRPELFFAGQITGVEGYLESAAMGLLAGINGARRLLGEATITFPPETAIGALATHVACGDAKHFEPMNVSFGLFAPLAERVRPKKAKQEALAQRALASIEEIRQRL